MTQTEVETGLEEFLAEDVQCEGDQSKDPHPADVYLRFECPQCKDSAVGPECIPCWQELKQELAAHPIIQCPYCGAPIPSADAFTEIGPVR